MLLGKVAFDIRKAYAPVVELTIQGYVVAVNPSLPVSSMPAEYRESVAREIARLEKFFRTPGISRDTFR